MRTRGLRLEFTDDGVIAYPKYSDYSEYEKNKIRKVYGTKINEALLKSFLEIKYNLKPNNYNSSGLNTDFINKLARLSDDDAAAYVKNISDKICDLCYDEYSASSRVFKRKIFDLCSNIKRETNSELREKILFKKMSILELIRADTLELAPEDVREKRKQEIEHHYIRNVIIKTNTGNEDDEQASNVKDSSTSDSLSKEEVSKNKSTISALKKLFKTSEPVTNSTDTDSKTSGSTVRKIKRLKGPSSDSAATDTVGSDTTTVEINKILGKANPTSHITPTPSNLSGTDTLDSVGNKSSSLSDHKPLNRTHTKKKIVLSDDEDFDESEDAYIKLYVPPECKDYTFEAINSRILKRLEKLPSYMAKPFIEPYTTGSKRVQILLHRSFVLNRRHKSD